MRKPTKRGSAPSRKQMTTKIAKPGRAAALPSVDAIEAYGSAHTELRDRIDELQRHTWDALNATDAKSAAESTAAARAALKRGRQALDRFGKVLDRRKRRSTR